MNILLTAPPGPEWDIYFPAEALARLSALGTLHRNDTGDAFTADELSRRIRGIDVCVTHWGTPRFDGRVLEAADKLKLIAHAAGSVADLVTEAVYARGIKVCSANTIMARYVAEGVLAYILSGIRDMPRYAEDMRNGLWRRDVAEIGTLLGRRVSLIGLGTVGRFLVGLMEPFGVEFRIYDPYLTDEAIASLGRARAASLDEALAWGDVVSVHASLTPETRHMLDAGRLRKIRDGALFVNTARGAVVDEAALLDELRTGRFRAVLDVYEREPLAADSGLRRLNNVTLMPHVAGAAAREQMTHGIIDEIGRFLGGEPLEYEIPRGKFLLMTRERDA